MRHEARTPQPASAASADRVPLEEDLRDVPLFPSDEADGFRARWEAIQTGFVDQPKAAVDEADALVNDVVNRLARVFSEERTALEGRIGGRDGASTEDLRLALKRYRALFHRLLSL